MFLEKIVIGSTVEAAFFSFVNDAIFINTRLDPPMFYNQLSVPIFGTTSQIQVWSKINLMLSFLGKHIRATEETSLKVKGSAIFLTDGLFKKTYNFDKCFIFDPTRIDLENEVLKAKEKFFVLDDLELSNLGKKYLDIQPKNSNDAFVKKINFYSSDRVLGSNYITDCVVESFLEKEQLYNYEYSDTITKFYIERYLENLNIKGVFMNFYKNGEPKYRKPKVKHVKRLVFKKDLSLYKNSDKIKFISPSLEEIINESST